MKNLLFLIALLLLGCQSHEKDLLIYKNGRQLLNLNETNRKGQKLSKPTVVKISNDTVKAGEKYSAKIFLSNENYSLVNAFFDCDKVDNPTVDTTSLRIGNQKLLDGCSKGLLVRNDTIIINFKPSTPGSKTFQEITILTRDRENIFRTQKYQFDFVVTE